ncbi:cephalosporin hydroxylase family protein [Paraglaciecola sp.]|uniref:cephalosporin hydroxylase family protein n=1 Tax=Paraglaciecola sp. TaxID=1920173 RepID=UPI003EF9B9D1
MNQIKSITINFDKNNVDITNSDMTSLTHDIGTKEAFKAISAAMLRSGWDNKYVYSFSWLGRPIIQLPDDMIRIQELIYSVKPDVVLETGVAHGGSLIFYASILKAMGKGRVIGIDIDIRAHNRKAIEEHALYDAITLFEGSSTSPQIIDQISKDLNPEERVIVFLDANHTKQHVLDELHLYSSFIPVGSYVVAMDGIMQDMVGAPRSDEDWDWNNPTQAAKEFVAKNDNFIIEEPEIPFNEGNITDRDLSYWPHAFIKRIG